MTKAESARENGKKGGRPRKYRPSKADTAAMLPLEPRFPLPPTIDNPLGLGPKELLFVEAYCGVANFNASKAYELAYGTAHRFHASRLAKNGHIQAAITAKLAVKLERLKIMDGDEALEGISRMGRVDIRTLFDPENGALLPKTQWPDATADAIKTITPTRYGLKVEMYDKLRARELMAKVAGRLVDRQETKHTFTLEDIVCGMPLAPEAAHRLPPVPVSRALPRGVCAGAAEVAGDAA